MRKYDELHGLIRSMNRNEKRSFKMDMQLHTKQGKNNYIELFDAIDQQITADEDAILLQFIATPLGEHLASVKYQLYNRLLKCLRTHHSSKTVESQLREYLENIHLLYARGRLSAAARLVYKGLKVARKYELWLETLHFLKWERTLFQVMDKSRFRKLAEMLEEGRLAAKKAQQELELQNLIEELEEVKAAAKDFSNVVHVQLLDRVAANEDVQNLQPPQSFLGRLSYYKLHSWIEFGKKKDSLAAQNYYKRALEWWAENSPQIALYPAQFTRDIIDYIRYAIRTEEVGDVLRWLITIDSLKFPGEYERINAKRQQKYIELMLAMNYPYKGDRVELAKNMQKWLLENSDMIEERWLTSFYYNFTLIFITAGEYDKAGLALRDLLNHSALNNRPDLRDFGRIMQIILQFEREEFDSAEGLSRSAYRYFKRQQTMMEFEKMVLAYWRTYLRNPHTEAAEKALLALQEKLRDEEDSQEGPFPLGTYEVRFWLESKIKKIPFAEVFRQKLTERPEVG